jgi:AcrR family transcriptional regulator
MTQTRASYHHGSLREELITACVALIAAEGIGAVSLRRVAREAGVSTGAPYHHFPDRAALLAAIAARGTELLAEQLREARAGAPTAVRALGRLVETFVWFARDQSAYLQVMFRPELSQPAGGSEAAGIPGPSGTGDEPFQILTEVVLDCQRDGTAPPGDPTALVGLVWALATGIATLWLDGPLQGQCASIGTTPEQLTAQITTLLEALLSPGTP